MLQVRVKFDLVDDRRLFCGFEDGVDVRLEEVGDANALCQALLFHFFHFNPGLLKSRFIFTAICEEGLVDEVTSSESVSKWFTSTKLGVGGESIQINIVKLEFLQRGFYCVLYVFDVSDDFGRHKQLSTLYAAFLDCFTQFPLGIVDYDNVSALES